MTKIGRNDSCPCGSGKKYKKCCLAETFVQVGKEDTIRKYLIDALMEFYEKNYRDTIEEAQMMFWHDFVPQEHLKGHDLDFAYHNFFEWITFDFIVDPDTNKTLIDLYMEQNKKISQDEHNVLTIMKNSCISLYEVHEVFPEKGLILKDLLMGGEYDVKERSATRELRKWDIFAARLFLIDGQYIMSGCAYPYSIMMKQEIIDDIMEAHREYQEEFRNVTMDMFLKATGDIFNFHWYEPILNPPHPPILHTTSGELMLFSKALFEIKDHDAVLKTLPEIKGFEQDQDDYTWFDKQDKQGSATILGTVEIKGNKLTLECKSKERLERGKKLIVGALQDAVVHKVDTFQSPTEAIKALKKTAPKHENDLPPLEIQQQFYNQFMQSQYEKWFHDKIPALDNKTPLEAIKTQQGKEKVIDLLKLYENGEEQNKRESRPYYDLAWIWQRLGLKKE